MLELIFNKEVVIAISTATIAAIVRYFEKRKLKKDYYDLFNGTKQQ